ncbi:MAG: DUF1858 domain-containing protein [Candidatus Micrarchaeia archaeon]
MKKKIKITKDMTFSQVLEKCPKAIEVFMEEQLYCATCPMKSAETVEQGCRVHGIDPDEFVKKLNMKCDRNG